MADLKTKTPLNLQDIDAQMLIKILLENQEIVIKSVLIIGTLFIAGSMFNTHRIKDQALRTQMTDLKDKISIIQGRDMAVADLTKFKSSLPKAFNEFELIALISTNAKLNHITLPSLSPTENKGVGLYDTINLTINAQSDNFKDIMLFLRKIERSDLPIRVESWIGRLGDTGQINFVMQISAVIVHT